MLRPDQGSVNHVAPRWPREMRRLECLASPARLISLGERGGKGAWENLVWSAKEPNQRKADHLPHEACRKLLSSARAPRELTVSALMRNAPVIEHWKLPLWD